jgi:hypothetical protein
MIIHNKKLEEKITVDQGIQNIKISWSKDDYDIVTVYEYCDIIDKYPIIDSKA